MSWWKVWWCTDKQTGNASCQVAIATENVLYYVVIVAPHPVTSHPSLAVALCVSFMILDEKFSNSFPPQLLENIWENLLNNKLLFKPHHQKRWNGEYGPKY